MLPQRLRLQRRSHFDAIYSHGRSQRGQAFTLRYLAISQPTLQMTVVVSRKVAKRAVKRNRLKRRLRSALYGYLANIRPGYLLIWTVRSAEPLTDWSWSELQAEVAQLLKAAGIWQANAELQAYSEEELTRSE